jgi:hypothetical protein
MAEPAELAMYEKQPLVLFAHLKTYFFCNTLFILNSYLSNKQLMSVILGGVLGFFTSHPHEIIRE